MSMAYMYARSEVLVHDRFTAYSCLTFVLVDIEIMELHEQSGKRGEDLRLGSVNLCLT